MNESEAIVAAVHRRGKRAAVSTLPDLPLGDRLPAAAGVKSILPGRAGPANSWTEGDRPGAGLPRESAAGPEWPDESRTSKTRNIPVEAAIIERCRSRKGSTEEALLELYHAAISMRRAEAVARTLWGRRMNAGTVSALNQRIAARSEQWRNRSIRGPHLYVFLGTVGFKRRSHGQPADLHVRVAIGVNDQGVREALGVTAGPTSDAAAWCEFLRHLLGRGLTGVRLFISDQCPEALEALAATFPRTPRQVCIRQLQRDLLARVPGAHRARVTAALEAVFASESVAEARRKAAELAAALQGPGLADAVRVLAPAAEKMLSYCAFPREHWRMLRSNFPLMQILRQIRERARVVGPFGDDEGATLMVSARLRAVATQWAQARSRLDLRELMALDPAPQRNGSTGG